MFSEIQKRLLEVQQARSNFQLAKFVIGQHGTEEMQYVQLLIELSALETAIAKGELSLREEEIKLEAISDKNKELEEIKKAKAQLDIDDLKIALVGSRREHCYLKALFDSVEHHFTREQIEDGQKAYWKNKLGSNAKAMIQGNNSVPFAYIESMEQAGVFEELVQELAVEIRESKEIIK